MKTVKLLTFLVTIFILNLNQTIAGPQPCNLHNHTQRLQKLKSQFSEYLLSTHEINNGYIFKFPNKQNVRKFLTEYIKTENECCSFLKLTISESVTEFSLAIEGNAQAKKLIANNLGSLLLSK